MEETEGDNTHSCLSLCADGPQHGDSMVMSKPKGLDGKGGSSHKCLQTQGRCDQNPERENREERGRKHKQKGEKGQLKEEGMEEKRRRGEKVKRHGEDKVPEQGRGNWAGCCLH